MFRSLLLLISVMLSLVGCASLPQAPVSFVCPPSPRLPPLEGLPTEVTSPSFLDRLESRMWKKPREPTSSAPITSSVRLSTNEPGPPSTSERR